MTDGWQAFYLVLGPVGMFLTGLTVFFLTRESEAGRK